MSYDIDLSWSPNPAAVDQRIPGTEINYTYNVSPMFVAALESHQGINSLAGEQARFCINKLERAVNHMRADKDKPHWAQIYSRLNPANGWGDAAGAERVLQQLLVFCCRYPMAYVIIE